MTRKLCLLLIPLMLQGSLSIPLTKPTKVSQCSYSEVVNDSEDSQALQDFQVNSYNDSSAEIQPIPKRIKHTARKRSTFFLTSEDVTKSTDSKIIRNQNNDYFDFDFRNYNTDGNCKDNLVKVDYSHKKVSNCSPIASLTGNFQKNDDTWTSSGTCFAVSDRVRLTAAHCVYDKKTSEFRTNLRVKAIQSDNDTSAFDYSFDVKEVIRPSLYSESSEYASDWAVLIRKENVGEKIGYFGISNQYGPYNSANIAAGYAGGLSEGDYRKGYLCYSAGYRIQATDYSTGEGLFNLNNYAVHGMSGGPLYFEYENEYTFESFNGVCGILTLTSRSDSHGYAVKINSTIINAVEYAEKEANLI